MLRYLAALPFLLLIPSAGYAQSVQAQVVGTCGTPNSTYVAGKTAPATQDTSGNLCTNATGGGGGGGSVTQGTVPWVVSGGGTAGSAAAGVVTIQGIASMTKLLVTPDSVALPANQSVNAAQFGGSNVVTGTGTSGAGIPRVTVSSDSAITPGGLTSTNLSSTIAVTSTFQSIQVSTAGRKGCVVQNNGTHNMNVFFGAIGSATAGSSVVLATGQAVSCAVGGLGVLTDQVSITGTSGEAFFAAVQ